QTDRTIELTLSGLSCGHCIKSVKNALDKIDGVENADVELTHAKVTGSVDAQTLISAIEEAGYEAQLASGDSPKTKPLTQDNTQLEASSAAVCDIPVDKV
ncbi:hypothetical protein CKA49_35545, partial [Pseudomonas aeruginosa]|uniref:cation transporter n=1 Tax=Pseudomonas aeruginosa TaxID=287 RepID=UPI000FF3418D